MDTEKKCEDCAFCKDGVCNFFRSPYFENNEHGVCEFFHLPTGKTIAEVMGDKGQTIAYGFASVLGAIWGNSFSVDDFMNQDSAFLDAYQKYYDKDKDV